MTRDKSLPCSGLVSLYHTALFHGISLHMLQLKFVMAEKERFQYWLGEHQPATARVGAEWSAGENGITQSNQVVGLLTCGSAITGERLHEASYMLEDSRNTILRLQLGHRRANVSDTHERIAFDMCTNTTWLEAPLCFLIPRDALFPPACLRRCPKVRGPRKTSQMLLQA